jgi:hypothetical protein
MPYVCANTSAITYGCNCVAQRKSLLQRQTLLFKPVHCLKHIFSVITVTLGTCNPPHTSNSVRCLSDMRSAYCCRTAYSTRRRPSGIYGMTHGWGWRHYIIENITSLKRQTENSRVHNHHKQLSAFVTVTTGATSRIVRCCGRADRMETNIYVIL